MFVSFSSQTWSLVQFLPGLGERQYSTILTPHLTHFGDTKLANSSTTTTSLPVSLTHAQLLVCKANNMCPLRFILIFLSATLAGFFLLRNISSENDLDNFMQSTDLQESQPSATSSFPSEVASAVKTGFWTFVDMASGRYLWRNLGSSSASVHSHSS